MPPVTRFLAEEEEEVYHPLTCVASPQVKMCVPQSLCETAIVIPIVAQISSNLCSLAQESIVDIMAMPVPAPILRFVDEPGFFMA